MDLWGGAILIGLVAFLVSIFKLIKGFIKKEGKKQALIIGAGSVLLMGGAASQVEQPLTLATSANTYETNQAGLAIIKGTTNLDAEVFIDDEAITQEDGSFAYEFHHDGQGEKTLTITSRYNDQEESKTLVIKPSKAYLAKLEEAAEKERIDAAEQALALAEDEPTQVNYDEAFTKVKALSQNDENYTERLKKVEKHIPILSALLALEKTPSRQDLSLVEKLVATAELNQADFTERLANCKTTIVAKEAEEKAAKLLAEVEKKIALAEKSKSDHDYQAAATALAALPKEDQGLTTRLTAVDTSIKQAKAQAKAAAAKKAAEQKAAAEEEQREIQSAYSQPAAASGEMVLITPTGSKYHRHKCGSGNYSTQITLAEAQQRGLTACKRCY